MFRNCNKLVSVDLSNLNSNNSMYLTDLFKDCINLEYINLSNFIENSNVDASNIFDGVPAL